MTATNRVLGVSRSARVKLDQTVDATTAKIAKAWVAAWDEVADEWREALLELASMADDDGWPARYPALRVRRAQVAIEHTAEQLDRLSQHAGVTIVRTVPDTISMGEDATQRLAALQLPRSGAGVSWTRLNPRAIDWMVARTTQQIESTLWPLSGDAQAVMRQTLLRGVIVGDSPRDAADLMLARMRGDFNGGLARAENIARTELLDAHRYAALESRRENRDVLAGWRWTCTYNARTCGACLAMDGQVFDLDTPGPHGHQSCRCVAVPVTKSWADLGFPGMREPADDTKTGRDWFDEQPERTQVGILGRKRLDALRSGRITWDDIPQVRQNPNWRPSVVVAPLAPAA